MNKNILVALDINLDRALEIVSKTKNYAYGFKIGMTLFNQIGQGGLKKFDDLNVPLFLCNSPTTIPKYVL